MRLGELLVHKGLITPDQLQTALQAQKRFGRRLGTSLVQLGYVAVDTIALALSEQLEVPPVLRKHVAAIDAKTLALFPARLVTAQRAVPIGYTLTKPGKVVVACESPANLRMEELTFAAGRRIEPWVAPEILLQQCLEKYFGARPIPSPYVSVTFAAQDPRRAPAPTPAGVPSIANAPPPSSTGIRSAAIAPPSTRAVVTLEMPEPPPSVTIAHASPAHEQPEILPLEEPPPPELLAPEAPALEEPSPEPPPPEEAPPISAPPEALRPVIDRAEASQMMEMATSKDQIGRVLEDWLRSTFGCGLVLVLKGEMAVGWKGFFPDADDLVEAVAIPIGKPGVFTTVSESHALYVGAPPEAGAKVLERLWRVLRCAPPQQILVCPVLLGKRAVNLIYAHMDDGSPIPQRAVEEAVTLSGEAAVAYARLIGRGKR